MTYYMLFKEKNPDISYVNINIINKYTIQILFGFDLSSINDIKIYAKLGSSLSSSELNDFCLTNKSIKSVCENSLFWIMLYNNKFGNISEWVTKRHSFNSRKFYIDILSYKECISNINNQNPDPVDLISKMDFNSLLYLMNENILDIKIIPYKLIFQSKHNNNIEIIQYILDNYNLTIGHAYYLYKKNLSLSFNKYTYDTRLINLLKKFIKTQ